jgi:hypothetical protein
MLNETDEKVTARELLDCLWVAATWLKGIPPDRLNENARSWPGLVDAILLLQQRLAAVVKEDTVLLRPAELAARGVGTSGTTGCRK